MPLTLEKCTSVPQWPRVSHGAAILEIHGKQDQRDAAKGEVPENEGPETPLPNPSDAAVKELIRNAKKRGYVTHDQINTLLSSEEVNSGQLEDILAKLSEIDVNVVETSEADLEEGVAVREELDEKAEGENELVKAPQQSVPAKSGTKEPVERTDDPVRMYLREMGTVKLLSREGEIAIAKRFEAGREAMIAGLCESPLHVPGHHHLAADSTKARSFCATSSTSTPPMRALT